MRLLLSVLVVSLVGLVIPSAFGIINPITKSTNSEAVMCSIKLTVIYAKQRS
jgi:hypothetical protein